MTFLSGFAEGYINERNRVQDKKTALEKEQRAMDLHNKERTEDFALRAKERSEDTLLDQQKAAAASEAKARERAEDRLWATQDSAAKAKAESIKEGKKGLQENTKANIAAMQKADERKQDRTYKLLDDQHKGFLEDQRYARKEKQDKEDATFAYRLKSLTDKKQQRIDKSEASKSAADQAKILAQRAGDPRMAKDFYRELFVLKISPEELITRIDKGLYVRNPNYKEPEQTLRLPAGVAPQRALFPADPVDQRIDAMDPSLRSDAIGNPNEDKTGLAEGDGGYVMYKPENKEVKYVSLDQAESNLAYAQAANDPDAIAKAKFDQRIAESVMTKRAMAPALAKARAEGRNVKPYVMLNPDGTPGPRFAGEVRDDTGTLWNVGGDKVDQNGQPIPIKVVGKAVPFDEKDFDNMIALTQRHGKQAESYNESNNKFIGAMTTMQVIDQILTAHPEVTTMSADVASMVQGAQDEVAGAYKILAAQQDKIESTLASENPAGVNKMVADYENSFESFSNQFLSQANQDVAAAKMLYEGQRKLLSYQMAGANGITGAGMSKKDQENFYEVTGGNKPAPAVRAAMYQTAYGVFNTLESARDTLNNNQEVKLFEQHTGIKTGLIDNDKRYGEKLIRMGKKELMPVLSQITAAVEGGRADAYHSATGTPNPADQTSAIPTGAAQALKQNPQLRDQFEAKYGPGSAAQILGE